MRLNKRVNKEHGQSLVEFALILPVLMLLILGVIDLGLGFKTYISLTNAAREGARSITIYPSKQDRALERVRAEATEVGLTDGVFVEGGYIVSFVPNQTNYAAGEKVTVQIDYDYELLFGSLTGLPKVDFTASSTMVVLYDE